MPATLRLARVRPATPMTAAGRVFKNIASSWFILVVNILVSFFLAPFVVNSLGNIWYGIWAIVSQFTGYLYLLDFGVRESVIRYTSKYVPLAQSQKLNRVITTAFILYTPIFFLCVLISFIAAWGFPTWFGIDPEQSDTARFVVILVGLTIAQTFVFNVFTGIIQGLHRFDVTNLFGVAMTLLRAALVVGALSIGYGIIALSLIQLLLALLTGLFSAFAALLFLKRANMKFELVRLTWRRFVTLSRRVAGYSLYVFINNIGQKISLVSDAIIIGIFMPVAFVTYYAIAGSLIGYLRNLVTATAQVFNPLTSHYSSLRDHAQVQQVLVRGSRLTILISLPVIASYMILGREFIGLWMGAEYMQRAGEVLAILAAVYVFSSPHHVISSVLYGLSQHRLLSYLRIGEAAANLALSILLVQKFGLVGVALGMVIPHFVMTAIVLPMLVTRIVRLPLRQYFVGAYLGPVMAIAPFAIGAMIFKELLPARNLLMFFAEIAFLVVIYLLTCYRLAITDDERSLVRSQLARIMDRLIRRPGKA